MSLQPVEPPPEWQNTVIEVFREPAKVSFDAKAGGTEESPHGAKRIRLSQPPFPVFGGEVAEDPCTVLDRFSVNGWRCVVFEEREAVALVDFHLKNGREPVVSGITKGEALQTFIEALDLALQEMVSQSSRFEMRCLDLLGIPVSALWLAEATGERCKDRIITRGPTFHGLARQRVWRAREFVRELVQIAQRRRRLEEELAQRGKWRGPE